MRTLHLFGDSYTEGHLLQCGHTLYDDWKQYRNKDLPLCWGDLLSSKLNMTMSNHAIAGMSNSEIFQKICCHSNEFEKDDIVIIGWTYPQRFRWAYWCNNDNVYKWKRLSPNIETDNIISEQTRIDITLNKILPPQINEIYEYEKLIIEYSKSKKFQVFFWSADIDIINNLPTEKLINKYYLLHHEINDLPSYSIVRGKRFSRSDFRKTIFDVFFNCGGTTICDETNGEVQDGHLGEKGHLVQYELFYKYIKENILI
jgi:hypothetical protein